ncbi:hypothetical protein DFH08DRAFT_845804 [Mycena albidolilacea]|uniref:SAM domain-containing protein n=1 Tax=Mycena albidolilacea TaxID=1033008 RepID=A0AAD7AHZ5_9AGAR|nr:hypothetical protein DFH08DRAFT_845804 [Mycena albidolilacea]
MPTVIRAGPPPYQQSGVGNGAGPDSSISSPLVSIDEDPKHKIPSVKTVDFCKAYGLSDDICERLVEEGYDKTASLFVEDEWKLQKLGFRIGHIAELRWTLKKMLLKDRPESALRNSREKYRPNLYGGHGGAGGHGHQKGGNGGIGDPPEVDTQDVFRFSVIGGGTGGDGGASGIMNGKDAALVQTQMAAAFGNGVPVLDTALQGGRGGRGGWGGYIGGAGGRGEGPQLAMEDVDIFKEIFGGQGGIGGASKIQGGPGGTGEAPNFTSLLFYIDDEIRRGVPDTQLNSENFSFNQALRERLQTHGFRTVGGLFETYEIDLKLVGFKPGQVSKLKAALEKVVAQVKLTLL